MVNSGLISKAGAKVGECFVIAAILCQRYAAIVSRRPAVLIASDGGLKIVEPAMLVAGRALQFAAAIERPRFHQFDARLFRSGQLEFVRAGALIEQIVEPPHRLRIAGQSFDPRN